MGTVIHPYPFKKSSLFISQYIVDTQFWVCAENPWNMFLFFRKTLYKKKTPTELKMLVL